MGKRNVNAGEMTKAEAIKKYDSKDNVVNSCTDCNRGVGGKHSKTPSTEEGAGKFKIDTEKASNHVNEKLRVLEENE